MIMFVQKMFMPKWLSDFFVPLDELNECAQVPLIAIMTFIGDQDV